MRGKKYMEREREKKGDEERGGGKIKVYLINLQTVMFVNLLRVLFSCKRAHLTE